MEEFWDSERLRFGEPGAKGWNSITNQEIEVKTDPAVFSSLNKNTYTEWFLMEQRMASHANLPARTLDETAPEDPNRVVLFFDIKDFVFQISSKDGEILLIDALLCYSALPPVSQFSAVSRWQEDPYLYQVLPGEGTTQTTVDASVRTPFTAAIDADTLFTSAGPFSAFGSQNHSVQLSIWLARGMEQLASSTPQNEHLGVYAIALTAARDASYARKLAKRLIKLSPDSAKLYNAYALVESNLGNQTTADKVWQMTITSRSNTDLDDAEILLLWRTWIFNAIRRGDLLKASSLLSIMTDDPPPFDEPRNGTSSTESTFAKTEFKLQSHLAKAISNSRQDTIIHSTNLLAMLRYCQSNQSLDPVLSTYLNVLNILSSNDIQSIPRLTLETLHQHRAHLIHHHTTSNLPFTPKHVLQTLSTSLRAFPNNSILITLHDQYQHKHGLMDRLRGIAASALHEPSKQSISQLAHTVKLELERSEDLGVTEHSIRAAFTRALDEEPHCPMLRVAYVRWELDLLLSSSLTTSSKSNKKDRKKVQLVVQAIYTAIRACPWVKELYLLAFQNESVRREFGEGGLKEIYEMMGERGLRIHCEFSEGISR